MASKIYKHNNATTDMVKNQLQENDGKKTHYKRKAAVKRKAYNYRRDGGKRAFAYKNGDGKNGYALITATALKRPCCVHLRQNFKKF